MGGHRPMASGSGTRNTNSDLYMWESTEDAVEFETDLIASTNEVLYSKKQLLCDSRHAERPLIYPGEIPHHLLRNHFGLEPDYEMSVHVEEELDLDLEMEICEFADDLRLTSERINVS